TARPAAKQPPSRGPVAGAVLGLHYLQRDHPVLIPAAEEAAEDPAAGRSNQSRRSPQEPNGASFRRGETPGWPSPASQVAAEWYEGWARFGCSAPLQRGLRWL